MTQAVGSKGDALTATINGAKPGTKELVSILEGYAILDREEFSCLKIQMDRDTIGWILKKEFRSPAGNGKRVIIKLKYPSQKVNLQGIFQKAGKLK